MYRIGIDLGGTNIAAGVVDEGQHIVAEVSLPTGAERPAEAVVADICRAAEKAMEKAGITAAHCASVGIGSPGTCDSANGVVVRAYNLGWFNVPVCSMVTARLGLPCHLSNDANCAALAETVAGGAVGCRNMILITLGTGVGGGIVADGQLLEGVGGILALLTAGCIVLGLLAQRDSAAAEAVPIGDEIYLGDYNYIDVQYMTTWAYRVTLGDGRKLVFYLAEDTEGYGYLVQLNDAEYARFADIVDYTYTDDSGDGAVPDDTAAPSELAVYIPLTETTAPAPVRLVGVICETPEAYIDDIAAAVGMTAEDFVYTYGDYYIDSELTPDTGSSFWSLIASFLGLAAFVLLVSAASYTAQLNSTLKHLKKGKLLERAESEFHYLEGDRRSDALVSTAFLYGRRQNIVLPLADVLWVYRHDLKLLWAKSTVVELLTYDGRSITLRLERGGSRRMADAIVQAVAARNPEALVGLNRENQRRYSQQVPHAKRKRVWATAAGIGGGVLGYAIARVLIRLLLS